MLLSCKFLVLLSFITSLNCADYNADNKKLSDATSAACSKHIFELSNSLFLAGIKSNYSSVDESLDRCYTGLHEILVTKNRFILSSTEKALRCFGKALAVGDVRILELFLKRGFNFKSDIGYKIESITSFGNIDLLEYARAKFITLEDSGVKLFQDSVNCHVKYVFEENGITDEADAVGSAVDFSTVAFFVSLGRNKGLINSHEICKSLILSE